MIRVQLSSSHVVGIGFQHLHFEAKHPHFVGRALISLPPTEDSPKALTTCSIWSLGDDGKVTAADPLGEGNAFCAPEDPFRKEFGRKLSLTRALQATGWPKATRQMVWDAYLNRTSHG